MEIQHGGNERSAAEAGNCHLLEQRAQTYEYHPDPEQVKNNDMVQAVLGMCLEKAKFNTNLVNMQMVQQAQMQAMQDQAIRSKLIH